MEGWRLHEAIGQNETEQKNRIMIVVIKHLMLYNGLEEIVGFEADTQTVYMTPPQASAIKRLAREQKTSESAILCRALEHFLGEKT